MYKNLAASGISVWLAACCAFFPSFVLARPGALLDSSSGRAASFSKADWVHPCDQVRQALKDALGAKVSSPCADPLAEGTAAGQFTRDLAAAVYPFKTYAALPDNRGHDVVAADPSCGNTQILNMSFLVQAVQGKLKH